MNIISTPPSHLECADCGSRLLISTYLSTKNPFIPYGKITICNSCLKKMIERNIKSNRDKNWTYINKLCQWIDIPFIADKWIKLFEESGGSAPEAFINYALIYTEKEYGDDIDWLKYNKEYIELKAQGLLTSTIEVFTEAKRKILKEKWGETYNDKRLIDLEALYEGVKNTHNITDPLRQNDAKKLCMISLEIDDLIRSGEPFDKQLNGYDKLKTSSGFTSQAAHNNSDFESVGEVFAYLEKRGWVNPYFQGANQDIVDASVTNMQAFAQRLYVTESGMGEAISDRLETLKNLNEDDMIYDLKPQDLDEYEKEVLAEITGMNEEDTDDEE